LQILYEHYMRDPLEMLTPDDLTADGTLVREDLVASAYYLYDRQFIELMIGYNPPMFAAARITPNGIDLVEDQFAFNLRFPAEPGDLDAEMADVPLLVERLVEEADFAPLDGEARLALLRDVQYLRDELSRPAHRWRKDVIRTVMDWIAHEVDQPESTLPSLGRLRERLEGANSE
jgi:hypothetical protein